MEATLASRRSVAFRCTPRVRSSGLSSAQRGRRRAVILLRFVRLDRPLRTSCVLAAPGSQRPQGGPRDLVILFRGAAPHAHRTDELVVLDDGTAAAQEAEAGGGER